MGVRRKDEQRSIGRTEMLALSDVDRNQLTRYGREYPGVHEGEDGRLKWPWPPDEEQQAFLDELRSRKRDTKPSRAAQSDERPALSVMPEASGTGRWGRYIGVVDTGVLEQLEEAKRRERWLEALIEQLSGMPAPRRQSAR